MSSHHPVLLEREAPRATLEQALSGARAGRGQIVAIEGEAGIGKTSLAVSFAEAHRHDARVYVGGCEHLATPEPLGPLRDIARDSEGRFAVSETSQLTTFEALLRLLKSGRAPNLLLIEDIHWADDATLDLLRYLGRRIREMPILIVATFRNDEAPSQSRLASLWSDMPRDCSQRIELQPLSAAAIAALAGQHGHHSSRQILEVTGGNPFHVTEFLAGDGAAVPQRVRDATLARSSRLTPHARRTLECASIFPRQIDQKLLLNLSGDSSYDWIEECMRAGMLKTSGTSLSFRHELARRAVQDSMAPLRRRELHANALALLKDNSDVGAAAVAHHAQGAGNTADLVSYSLRAADEAGALGSHRQSVEHLTRALEHATLLSDAQRADLLQRLAEAGEQCGAFDVAMKSIEQAIAIRRATADVLGLGNALRTAARLHWHHGQPAIAERMAGEALDTMRDHRSSWQYAMALSTQSQLDMLADRNDLAIPRAQEAMALAENLRRDDIFLHALTNGTTARCSSDVEEGLPHMLAAIAEARRRNAPDLLPRLYANLVYMMTSDRRYGDLFQHFEQGVNAATARENAPFEAYIRGTRAIALVDIGRIPEGTEEAELVIYGPFPRATSRFNAKIALARARIRTGQPEDGVLDELRSMPTSERDIMRRAPLAVVDAEALWLGLPRPGALERLRAAFRAALHAQGQHWTLADTALWLRTLGDPVSIPEESLRRLRPAPRAHVQGHWREAAKAWSETSCPYEQAMALSLGDESSQLEALAILDRLGAAPAASKLRREMRARGARGIPRGPNAHTKANPVGLTRRQAQVLALLDEGLSTGRIAERLYISPKTTQHHVSAIIAQLGASTRQEAAAAARRRGLLNGHQELGEARYKHR
jgi:DNA-binding CsgD family transcriptional regulator/tetratricopeptide (TPR) repeat protein